MKAFDLAHLSLRRRKVSTLIAMIAIAFSVAVSSSLYQTFRLVQIKYAGLVGGGTSLIGSKSGNLDILLGALNAEGPHPGYIPQGLADALTSAQGLSFQDGTAVDPSSFELTVPLFYHSKYKDHWVLGTNERFQERPFGDDSTVVKEGRWFSGGAEIVVGAQVAAENHLQVGDRISIHSWSPEGLSSSAEPMTVVGILRRAQRTWDRILFTSLDEGRRIMAADPQAMRASVWGTEVLSYLWVFQSGEAAKNLEKAINQRSVAQFVPIYQTKKRWNDLLALLESFGQGVILTITLLASLCVAAILVTRFESMNLQIAVLRALGHPRSLMVKWLFAEGLLLGGASVAVGILLQALLAPQVAEWSFGIYHEGAQGLILAWPVWLGALLAALLTALVPVYRTLRVDVHTSLRKV